MSQRVFVAMSGGVDSAAAALLLRQAGYNVTGVTLRLHPYKDRPGLCGSADDIETARAVAAGMGIPHVVLDLCDLFRERVMDRFVWAYTHGRTPNPCIDCNREIKFGALLDWALDQGADAMATGHYARVRLDTPSGRWQLLRGADRRKDQTYFLYQLTQHQLAHLLLPVGDYEKPALRAWRPPTACPTPRRPTARTSALCRMGTMCRFCGSMAAWSPSPVTSWTQKAVCWAATGEWNAIPSASGKGWASAPTRRSTCWGRTRTGMP